MTVGEHAYQRGLVSASLGVTHKLEVYPVRAGLDGPSRRVTVEPVELPDVTPREEPAPAVPQETPSEPEKVPVP